MAQQVDFENAHRESEISNATAGIRAMGTHFLGNEMMSIDEKGRVGIPARYMSVLRAICPDQTDKVGVLIDADGALKVMPIPVFEKFMDSLNGLNELIEDERILKTMYTSTADELELDKQNRIRLSAFILKDCKIKTPGQVVVAGNQDHLRIFDETAWENYRERGKPMMNKTSAQFAKKEETKPIVQYVINAPGVTPEMVTPGR